MASEDHLIQNGIQYTEELFKTILKRVEPHVYDSETLEEFLERTAPYTIENPMITLNADEHAVNSVLLSVAGKRYSYEANRRLTEQTIQDTTAELITRVGEDVKQTIRDTIQKGFRENKLRQNIMKDLTSKVNTINNTRAKVIYRTEIKRAQTISNYISARERGANAFYCNCNHPCEICSKRYGGGGPGSKIYSMRDDKDMLPPVHPNCRCSAVFIKDDNFPDLKEDNNTTSNMKTPFDEDINEVEDYIKELNNELSELNDKYEIEDLKEEIKIAKDDLKAFKMQRTEYLKSKSSTIKKIQPEKIKFTNDTNIENKPREVQKSIGYHGNNIPKSVRGNMNNFAKRIRNEKIEYQQYYTESGKISDISKGTSKKVNASQSTLQWKETMKKHGENIHLTHNHPGHNSGYTLLSPGDIEVFKKDGLQSMSAETGKTRVTIGKLPSWKQGEASEKALSDIFNLTLDLERGKNLKRWDTSRKEGFENFVHDANQIAEKGGYYYKIEELDLSDSKNKFPQSNMKDERTKYEKTVDRINELSMKITAETNAKRKLELQKEYQKLTNLI